jgi:uridine kinase
MSMKNKRTYLCSLFHILAKAVNDILPETTLYIEHTISKGYYCRLENIDSISEKLLSEIKDRMKAIISADYPFVYKNAPTAEAVKLFRSRGMDDKARLLETAALPSSPYYELDGYCDYFFGSPLSSSGGVNLFDVEPLEGGFLLRIPQLENPDCLEPTPPQQKMFEVYKESLSLLCAMGMTNVGDLNKAVEDGRGAEMILVAEAMQEKQIAHIAEKIAERYKSGMRIALVSGPSSSGKTTFAQRLGIQLQTNYLHPVKISLDDYFLNRTDTPKDETGDYDYESLYALDLELLNKDLQALFEGKEIELPTYNFKTGNRTYSGKRLSLGANSILVAEGIHALNPELTAFIPDSRKYRIYVSALTAISLDNHNLIPTSDNRLLRRIIRDYRSRNYSAAQTIQRWPSVRRGEDKWIFPFQETADSMFNSAMLYELAAIRRFAEPVLKEVNDDCPEYGEAMRLLTFLQYFNPLSDRQLPATSLLREFLGGSIF